jgi:hypothetical protein
VRKADDPAFEWKICGFSALLERGAIPASSALFRCCGYEGYASFKNSTVCLGGIKQLSADNINRHKSSSSRVNSNHNFLEIPFAVLLES